MKRTQDKIRDFVEPQAYDEVHDFVADPARALAAYRFTDATSDLLSRWLDALADLPRGTGAAHALAGLRGVGKSHTLAAFGALIGSGALRQNVADAHVAASARRLTSRRYPVVRVERGTRQTFAEELASALVKTFGGHAAEWDGAAPADALAQAARKSQGSPVVLLVDTAYGRGARVSRDDGPALAALAAAASGLDAFVGLALDDDIAGAEGANVALSQTFRIDYLEPEHLYHVANNYLLRKSPPARDRLHEIYLQLRSTVPNFNWSEPRFAALYPVHPLVADVAASVRLHAHSFAFLPFAAAASVRAVGRPALSLILLDEVFDQTERELRQARELRDAFATYDELTAKAVGQFPALQRLQVRLVLKNLLILSLDGRGATARDLCAALLLLDETAAQPPLARVEETLAKLAGLAPNGGLAKITDGGEDCYRFQLSASSGFDEALTRAVKRPLADSRAVNDLLASLARSRFDDWPLADATVAPSTTAAAATAARDDDEPAGPPQQSQPTPAPPLSNPFAVVWRGTLRHGRLLLSSSGDDAPSAFDDEDDADEEDGLEWQVLLLEPGAEPPADFFSAGDDSDAGAKNAASQKTSRPMISLAWQPAELTAEEWSLLRRLHALRTDSSLANFGEAARVAANSLAVRAERVWTRLYVDEGVLVTPEGPRPFTTEARAGAALAAVLGRALAPLFDERHPRHPQFAGVLCEQDVASLVENFFCGAHASAPDTQRLAEQFAYPLGLAAPRGAAYAPASGDDSAAHPWAREVLSLLDAAGGEMLPAAEVRRALSRTPSGLTAESRQLVLAALVAARRVELVTASGDRVSRRTLGRAVNWADVAGVSRPEGIRHSAEELTDWARRLTNCSDLPVIDDDAACDAARAALSAWLANWRARTTLRDFDELPDSGLTTRTWKLAAAVRAAFEAAADAAAGVGSGDLALEEGLQRVADTFGSSAEEFARAAEQLEALAAYTEGLPRRERARDYLTSAEPTGVGELESARRELLAIADDPHTLLDADSRERFDLLWGVFRERYAALYADAHERAVGALASARRERVEEFTRTDEWRELEALAALPFVNSDLWREARTLAGRALSAGCVLPVARLVEERPRCACGFRLAASNELSDAPARLAELTERARAAHRRTLSTLHEHLARSLRSFANNAAGAGADVVARADSLANSFARGETPPQLSPADVWLVSRAFESEPQLRLVRVAPPVETSGGIVAREELAARVGVWLEDLPRGPALVEIVSDSRPNAPGETLR